MTKLRGITGPHLDLKAQMTIVVERLEPKLFNWCQSLLVNLRDQVTRCKSERQKEFGYGSILVSFFLERVPLLRPQMDLPIPSSTIPRMERWTSLIPRIETSGPPLLSYDEGFFS